MAKKKIKNPTPNQIVGAVYKEERVIDTEALLIQKDFNVWMEDMRKYMLSNSTLSFAKWRSMVLKKGEATIKPIVTKMERSVNRTSKGLNTTDKMDVPNIAGTTATALTKSNDQTGTKNKVAMNDWAKKALSLMSSSMIQKNANGEDRLSIVRGTMGSAAEKYKNGALSQSVTASKSLTATLTKSTTETIRKSRYESDSAVQGYIYLALLDGRTSQTCQGLHAEEFYFFRVVNGKKVPLSGAKPRPPQHPNCRSSTQPIYVDLPPPEVKTFEAWAKDPENKTELLESMGPTRYNMYESGEISITRFTDARAKPLTLDQLNKQGFSLDP